MIYFVQAAGGTGPIKIGYHWHDSDIHTRLVTLQTGSPVPLVCLAAIADGDLYEERQLHERFAEQRLYGEWFAPCTELLALVQEKRAATPPKVLDYQCPVRPKRGNWNPTARYRNPEDASRRARSGK